MFKVITPATTANIGPGFDILGLALNLYNTFTIKECDKFELHGFEEKYNNKNNSKYLKDTTINKKVKPKSSSKYKKQNSKKIY